MYAVIRAGARQFKVASGDVIDVDRIRTASEGDEVSFPALMVVDGENVKALPADLAGVSVKAKVVGHKRGKKIRVFNYGHKAGWKRTRGYRAELTAIEITGISSTAKRSGDANGS